MIATSMISFLFGAVLGQRFTVLVLIPAMVVVAVGAAITHPQASWWIVALAAVAAVCLQCGYFVGIILRQLVVAAPVRPSTSVISAEHSNAAR